MSKFTTTETLKLALDGVNSVAILEERELTAEEMTFAVELRAVLSSLIPTAPRVTGKKIQVLHELDLAVPQQRDAWFRSLGMSADIDSDMIPGKTSKGKNGFVAAVLTVDGIEVARIASENAMELMFFGGLPAAYEVWKQKGVKDPSADGVTGRGRMPGKEILALSAKGFGASQIAEAVGREESAVAEWLAKNAG